MSNKNSEKGAAKLASVLQARMAKVSKRASTVTVEQGEIMKGNKLKLYSVPDAILDKDDYSVCATVYDTKPLKAGDKVLIVWTFDGEPVVVDRIVGADAV